MLRIAQIYLFPIKSCGGYAVTSASLESRGFAGDRRYMLVDERGLFLTQRTRPKMALIETRPVSGGFTVIAPDRPAIDIPPALTTGASSRVTVWRDQVDALEAPPEINRWFCEVLDLPCRLVYMHQPQCRAVKSGYGRPEDRLSFADGAPVLLISMQSLDALNRQLPRPAEMLRFRPNLVVEAGGAFAEDSWRYLRVGEATFEVGWACTRCPVPTVDPATGIRDPQREPLRTLRLFRNTPEGVIFGQNLIPRGLGRVCVGDAIELIESLEL